MKEVEALEMIIRTGAVEHNANPDRAVAAFRRLIGKTPPLANKEFFYELCAILGQGKQTVYTTARANKLKLRLKTYDPESITKAAKAIASDDYMMGSSGRRYGTIDYLLRNDEQIDTWIQNGEAKLTQAKAASRLNAPKIPPPAPTITEEQREANLRKIAEMKQKFNQKRTT